MMTINKAIETLKQTAWIGKQEKLDEVTEAVAIAEWCMKKARKEFENAGFSQELRSARPD